MLKDLIKLANHLDSKGYTKEADQVDRIIRRFANDSNILNIDMFDDLLGSGDPPEIPPDDSEGGGDDGKGENSYYKRLFQKLKGMGFEHYNDESVDNYFHMDKDYEDLNSSFGQPEFFRVKTSINTSISQPSFDLKFSFVTEDDEGSLEVGQQELLLSGFELISEEKLSKVFAIFKKLDDFFSSASMADVYEKYHAADFEEFNCLKYALIGEG